MIDVAVFAALGWERRAATRALLGLERGERPRTWRGRLGDGASCVVVQTGVGAARARAAAEAMPAAGRFFACGCAGALVSSLATGDLVVAAAVLPLENSAERLLAESASLAAAIAAAGLAVRLGDVASSRSVLGTTAAKQAAAACGALVVEMESVAIADVARRRGVPFTGLRVVLDGADDAIPDALAVVDGATGAVRATAAAALVLRPRLWPALVRLARQSRVADLRLRRALAAVFGQGLGAFDAGTSAGSGPEMMRRSVTAGPRQAT